MPDQFSVAFNTMVETSAPFVLVMMILTVGLIKQLRAEPLPPIHSRETEVVPVSSSHSLEEVKAKTLAAAPTAG